MKNVIKIVVAVIAVLIIIGCFVDNSKHEYIGLQVISNSSSDIDNNIRLNIKDRVNSSLCEKLKLATSKEDGLRIIEENINNINLICNRALSEAGVKYSASVGLKNEYYQSLKNTNTTLEAGYYDVLSIRLGSGMGDNWWCVMYPPVCSENKTNFTSRIKDFFLRVFG